MLDALCFAKWTFDPTEMTAKMAAAHCCVGIWDICWTFTGSVLFTQMSRECQRTHLGIMLFGWIIVNWIYVGCRCVFVISGCWISDDATLVTVSRRQITVPSYRETPVNDRNLSKDDEDDTELMPQKDQDL